MSAHESSVLYQGMMTSTSPKICSNLLSIHSNSSNSLWIPSELGHSPNFAQNLLKIRSNLLRILSKFAENPSKFVKICSECSQNLLKFCKNPSKFAKNLSKFAKICSEFSRNLFKTAQNSLSVYSNWLKICWKFAHIRSNCIEYETL